MLHKASVILFATACFAVAAATLVTGSTSRAVTPRHEIAHGSFGARQAPAKLLGGCLEEPVECGLVVW